MKCPKCNSEMNSSVCSCGYRVASNETEDPGLSLPMDGEAMDIGNDEALFLPMDGVVRGNDGKAYFSRAGSNAGKNSNGKGLSSKQTAGIGISVPSGENITACTVRRYRNRYTPRNRWKRKRRWKWKRWWKLNNQDK